MAKASSPIRLQNSLMESAASTASALHRSVAEQVEYWAEIGKFLGPSISPDDLLALRAGIARVSIEIAPFNAPEADAVFGTLEAMRQSGELSSRIANGKLRYQASQGHPGKLEQILPDGSITVGEFQSGEFTPLSLSHDQGSDAITL